MIAWQVDADDFEGFAISTNRLCEYSRPRFNEHRSCKPFTTVVVGQRLIRYETTSISDVATPDTWEAFNDLVDNPAHARHVQSLKLIEWSWVSKDGKVKDSPLLVKKLETFVEHHASIEDSGECTQRRDRSPRKLARIGLRVRSSLH